jgi:hypothetical protein
METRVHCAAVLSWVLAAAKGLPLALIAGYATYYFAQAIPLAFAVGVGVLVLLYLARLYSSERH